MNMSSPASREGSTPRSRGFHPPKDSAYLWEALTEDTNVSVMMADEAGIIEYANGTLLGMLGLDAGTSIVGRPLSDFFPNELIEDRLSMTRDRVMAGKPVQVEGMCLGRLMRSTFRLVPGSPARVLVVSRLSAPAEPLKNAVEPGVLRARVDDPGSLSRLTAREMEILKLIGLGLSSAEIARRLERSVKTVEWHRVSLGDKLGVTNRVELARIAIGAGLVGVQNPKATSGESPAEEN